MTSFRVSIGSDGSVCCSYGAVHVLLAARSARAFMVSKDVSYEWPLAAKRAHPNLFSSARRERLLWVDSVEKVGLEFHGRKVRA